MDVEQDAEQNTKVKAKTKEQSPQIAEFKRILLPLFIGFTLFLLSALGLYYWLGNASLLQVTSKIEQLDAIQEVSDTNRGDVRVLIDEIVLLIEPEDAFANAWFSLGRGHFLLEEYFEATKAFHTYHRLVHGNEQEREPNTTLDEPLVEFLQAIYIQLLKEKEMMPVDAIVLAKDILEHYQSPPLIEIIVVDALKRLNVPEAKKYLLQALDWELPDAYRELFQKTLYALETRL